MINLPDVPLIFMGTPSFAANILAFLLEKKCSIAAVYTNPPKPKGRGHDVALSPVHLLALRHDIPVFTPASLRSPEAQSQFLTLVQSHNIKAALVVAYGFILPKIILEAPPLGCLNVHASLLPRWRGASPIQRAIEAGDSETGLALMKITEGLDEGPIILESRLTITPQETSETLFEKLSQIGGPLILKGLSGLLEETLFPEAQSQNNVTYAPKVLKEEGLLDFQESALVLERKIRAFTPWPGTFFNVKGLKIKVLEAHTETTSYDGVPGEVISVAPLKILCGTKTVLIPLKLQRPGGTVLQASDFLRGFPIDQGTLLKDTHASL